MASFLFNFGPRKEKKTHVEKKNKRKEKKRKEKKRKEKKRKEKKRKEKKRKEKKRKEKKRKEKKGEQEKEKRKRKKKKRKEHLKVCPAPSVSLFCFFFPLLPPGPNGSLVVFERAPHTHQNSTKTAPGFRAGRRQAPTWARRAPGGRGGLPGEEVREGVQGLGFRV